MTTRGGCVYSVVKGASDNFDIEINSSVEFDGYCEFSVRLKCVRDVKVDDITLSLPMSKDKTKYFADWGDRAADSTEKRTGNGTSTSIRTLSGSATSAAA